MAADVVGLRAEMLAADAAYDAERTRAFEVIALTLGLLFREYGAFSYPSGDFWRHIREEADRIAPSAPSLRYAKRRISSATRKRIFERDAYRCVSCGRWKDLTIDHKIPESRGGGDEDENLQTMCAACNGAKGTKLE